MVHNDHQMVKNEICLLTAIILLSGTRRPILRSDRESNASNITMQRNKTYLLNGMIVCVDVSLY